jgi:hypothetical protein
MVTRLLGLPPEMMTVLSRPMAEEMKPRPFACAEAPGRAWEVFRANYARTIGMGPIVAVLADPGTRHGAEGATPGSQLVLSGGCLTTDDRSDATP